MKTGVIVARFQVPYLHEGHEHLINSAWEKSDKLLFVLGSPTKPNERNPLPYDMREQMIREYFSDIFYNELNFREILDHHEDARWSEHLDAILDQYEGVTLYGSRDCFHKFYTGKYPFEEISEIPGVSGTNLREEYSHINPDDYRAGYIAGVTQLLKNQ